MTPQYIRRPSLNALKEFLVVNGVLRSISQDFDEVDIELSDIPKSEMSGERRQLIERYYQSLDLSKWGDVQKLLQVFEKQLAWMETNNRPELMDSLLKPLDRDGFVYTDGRLRYVRSDLPALLSAQKIVETFDLQHMARQIERCNDSCETDPDAAIGAAKELIETCCKTILFERQVQFNQTGEISELVKAVTKELKLNRDDIPEVSKGAEIIKRLLSNLASVSQSMAELRNIYGTGHGRDGRVSSVKPRHAKLAVGAASTLVVFLYETHLEQMNNLTRS